MAKAKAKLDLSAPAAPLQDPFAALTQLQLPEGNALPAPRPTSPSQHASIRGRVILRRETSGRGGKTVVVAGDFPETVSEEEITEIARSLRRALGCGGTVRGREIEIQGERAPDVRGWLEKAGFRVAGP